MPKHSAGILCYKFSGKQLFVFLIHPGGPFFAKKDLGAWSIPKGEINENENPLDAAKREFKEETSFDVGGNFIELKPVKQNSGKIVHAWALQAELDASKMQSNFFGLEWPPNSGKILQFPEADKAAWFTVEEAKKKILKGQLPIIDELVKKLGQENQG